MQQKTCFERNTFKDMLARSGHNVVTERIASKRESVRDALKYADNRNICKDVSVMNAFTDAFERMQIKKCLYCKELLSGLVCKNRT
jgi:hypothetical protein